MTKYHVIYATYKRRDAEAWAEANPGSWVWVTGSGVWEVRVEAR